MNANEVTNAGNTARPQENIWFFKAANCLLWLPLRKTL